MFPLFESVCLLNGEILNSPWHLARFEKSFFSYYGEAPTYSLFQKLSVPKDFQKDIVKVKILYNKQHQEYHLQKYEAQNINTVKLVHTESIDYSLKYSDREKLDKLFALRDGCDDVLIVKNGCITDSSYANIIFFDGSQWFTPKNPLLKGTCRARLLENNDIKEALLHVKDLSRFKGFKLINAMRDFNMDMISIEKITA
ncbi:aminotransferase class IV family protein [Flavobacteriaceae bacterium]|jgi:4-amino-4-deoxychorismate lyase|nr:aminotransferase class IV family protein [Flavobacteriaceae bacterium]MDA9879301.1 aminotransferase class IV family protein [Flavobacteriaceae bacterium]